MSEKTQRLISGLHLFALAGFAIAQPLFDLLARYSIFFIAQQSTPADIILLVFFLLFVPPLLAWVLELVLNLLAPRSQGVLHLLLLAILTALLILPALKHVPRLPGAAIVFLALAAGCVFSFVYFRSSHIRSLVSVLALAPICFATFFIFSTPVLGLLSRSQDKGNIAVANNATDPVIMLIFDGLSTISLMDEHRQIDSKRYPAFAALGKNSTWFRNATTVHDRTLSAVPAILTGKYPTRKSLLPTGGDYPQNLFALLRGAYRMNIHESVTRLYLDRSSHIVSRRDGFLERLKSLYLDLFIVYLHVVLPKDFALDLPPLEERWEGFAGAAGPGERGRRRDRKDQFYAFLESIEPCEKNCLHFLHTLLPHPPWQYLPSGKKYYPNTVFGAQSSRWGEQEWWVVQGYQRHLLQVAFADKLLDELIGRLKSLGMYDRSLIVVTADHGRSFWPNENQRNIRAAKHPEEILGVPLLIKAPHQQTGEVSDRNVETIDILPTMADLLGIKIGWPVDGCSAVAAGCPERAEKIVAAARGKRISFPPDVLRRSDSLNRKMALFGSGAKANGLFAIGSYPNLVGQTVAEIGVKGQATSMFLSALTSLATASDDYVPARVIAFLHSSAQFKATPHIAVSANGIIEVVAPVLPDGQSRLVLSAMVPEEALQKNHRDFQFFLVQGPPEKPELFQIPVR